MPSVRVSMMIPSLLLLAGLAVLPAAAQSVVDDTYVLSGEYQDWNFCTEDFLTAGTLQGQHGATYLKLDHAIPADHQVDSATLRLNCAVLPQSGWLDCCMVANNDWDPCSLTWANQPGGNPPPVTTAHVDDFGWVEFDVTEFVRAWHEGSHPDLGLLVYSAASNPAYVGFVSSRHDNASRHPQIVIQHSEPTQADLTITELQPEEPYVVEPGQVFGLGARVANQGDAAAPATRLGWYVSAHQDGPWQLVGDSTVPQLPPGGSSFIVHDFSISDDMARGGESHYFVVRADLDEDVAESDEDNNWSNYALDPGYMHIIVDVPDYHDLVVSELSSEAVFIEQGQAFSLDFTVLNDGHGSEPCNPIVNTVLLSTDAVLDDQDRELAPEDPHVMGGLAGQEQAIDSYFLTMPHDVPPGVYFVGVYTDFPDVVVEADETNNTNYQQFIVQEASFSVSDAQIWLNGSTSPPDIYFDDDIIQSATIEGVGDGDVDYRWDWRRQGEAWTEGLTHSIEMVDGSAVVPDRLVDNPGAGTWEFRLYVTTPNEVASNTVAITVLDHNVIGTFLGAMTLSADVLPESGALASDYQQGRKRLAWISSTIPPLDVGCDLYVDLCDYWSAMYPAEAITGEGADGWITVWVDVSMGLGVGVFPVGIGLAGVEFEAPLEDPRREWGLAAASATMPFCQTTAISWNEDGYDWGAVSHDFAIDFNANIVSLRRNVARFEVQRDVLDGLVETIVRQGQPSGFLDGGMLGDRGASILDAMVDFVEWRARPGLGVAHFTATDDHANLVHSGELCHLGGGYDLDEDGVPDNVFPVMPDIGGIPFVGNVAQLTLFNTGTNLADFLIEVEEVPTGWWIAPEGDDDLWGPFVDRDYDADDVPPADDWDDDLVSTEWFVAAMEDGPETAMIRFNLYEKTGAFETTFLDSVSFTLRKADPAEMSNDPPSLQLTEPAADTQVASPATLPVAWSAADPEGAAAITIAIDPDLDATPWEGEADHQWLSVGIAVTDPQSGDFAIPTSVPDGQYTVWAMIYDGFHPEVYARAAGTVTVLNQPALSFEHPELVFGGTLPGEEALGLVTVTNTGYGVLSGSVTTEPPFAVVAGESFSLTHGESWNVTVSFTPDAVGEYEGELQFDLGAEVVPYPVSGACVQPSLAVDAAELNFGAETDEMVFEVWNDGSGDLVYEAVVDDEAAPYFTVEPAEGASTGPDDRQPHTVTLDRDLLESGQVVTGAIMLHAEHADDAPQYVTLRAEGVVVGVADLPETFAFHPCYPNPCNPQTTLAFDLPREAVVTLSVFDLRGRRVRRLIAAEPRPAGRHRIVWDVRGDDGGRVASGIYLCRFEAGDYRERRSLTVIE